MYLSKPLVSAADDSTGMEGGLWIGDNGWYRPYDFWLSLCGIYDLYAHSLRLLGDMQGRQVLDCGCGPGHTSVMLAKHGAHVTAFDISQDQLVTARALAEANGVRVELLCMPFEKLDLPKESFGLAFGAFILHHADLAKAGRQLFRILRPGGRAVFVENSARNPVLMGARRCLCGRFGIPKYSDDREHPLTLRDIAVLRENFPGRLQVHYTSLVFFRLADYYIFRKRWPKLTAFLRRVDEILGYLPAIRQYSYWQIIELEKEGPGWNK